MQGIVKLFKAKQKFGFIWGQDSLDYFVHQTQVKGFRSLAEGDTVEFDVRPSQSKPGKYESFNVRLIE